MNNTAFLGYSSFPGVIGPIVVEDYSEERGIEGPDDNQLEMWKEEEDA